MTATDAQVKEKHKNKQLHKANLKSRKTAGKYEGLGKLPSELKKLREYRTRNDPFEDNWLEAEKMLEKAPELEAKTLFE